MSERYDRSSRGDGRDRYESDRRRNGDEGQHPSSSSARGARGYDDGDRRGGGGEGYGASSRGGGERRRYERDSRRRSRSRSPPRRGPPGRGDYREDRDRDRRPPGAEGGSRPGYDSRDRRDDRDRRDPRDREADDRRRREYERPDTHRDSDRDRRDRGDGRSPAPLPRDSRQSERQTSLSGPSVPEAVQDQGKPAASAAGSDTGGQEDEDDDEAAMAAMLGFGGFGSSKGKKIEGNADIGMSKTNQPRVIRQYMNRAGGFNRPLDRIK